MLQKLTYARQHLLIHSLLPVEAARRAAAGEMVMFRHYYMGLSDDMSRVVQRHETGCTIPMVSYADADLAFPNPDQLEAFDERWVFGANVPYEQFVQIQVPGSNSIVKWWMFWAIQKGLDGIPMLDMLNECNVRCQLGQSEFGFANFEVPCLEAMKAWLHGRGVNTRWEDGLKLHVCDASMVLNINDGKQFSLAEPLLQFARTAWIEPNVSPVPGYYAPSQ